jgi:hypothetical protein
MRLLLLPAMFALASCAERSECKLSATQVDPFDLQSLTLPKSRTDFPYVLANGKTNNQIGNFLGFLGTKASWGYGLAQEFDPQPDVDRAFADGIIGASLSLLTDPKAPDQFGAILAQSLRQHQQAFLCGSIANEKYQSVDAVDESAPATLTLTLPIIESITIQIVGVQLTFARTVDTLTGQLQGAIPVGDVERAVVPALARLLSKQIADDPSSDGSRQVASVYDNGGYGDGSDCRATRVCGTLQAGTPACRNPVAPVGDGRCADACDQIIDTCEVARNNIVRNILSADVQLFTDDGTKFQPKNDGMHKDSLSLGIGFTAKLRE